MKAKIKAVWLLVCAVLAVLLIPVFLSKDEPIEVYVPLLDQAQLEAKEAQKQKEAAQAAAQLRQRRMYSCTVDEDCIIVDKDPCGCLVGPKGVVAINASYTLEFNRQNTSPIAKACPEGEPSIEKECSPTAQAVCERHYCKIIY